MTTEIGTSPFFECQGYGQGFKTAAFDKAESTLNFFRATQ